MSTNTPKAPYGYMPAKLGGEGMGELTEYDKYWAIETPEWQNVFRPKKFFKCSSYLPKVYYTRPIDVGPENELVGEDDSIKGCEALTYKNEWKSTDCCSGLTVKEFIEKHPAWGITAIRRRKVVKDGWPKFMQKSDSREIVKFDVGMKGCIEAGVWLNRPDKQWIIQMASFQGDLLVAEYKEKGYRLITPQRAFELTGDKTILEKGGDEKCSATVANASNKCPEEQQQSQTAQSTVSHTQSSPAPEVTKGASNVCDVTDEESELTEDEQRVLAKINRRASPPQWISVEQFNLQPHEPFHSFTNEGRVITWNKGARDYSIDEMKASGVKLFIPATGIYQVPPPPQPKTREQEDEEWIQSNFARYCGAQGNYQSWAQGCNAAIQRERKGEK